MWMQQFWKITYIQAREICVLSSVAVHVLNITNAFYVHTNLYAPMCYKNREQ